MDFLVAAGAHLDRLAAELPTAPLRPHSSGERTVKRGPGRLVVTIGDGQLDGMAITKGKLVGESELKFDGLDSFVRFSRRTRGNFMVVGEHGDELLVGADPLGTYPLFFYDRAPFLLSNNIFLMQDALSLLDVELAPNNELFAWEATLKNGWFDQSGFEEVRLLPIGAVAVIAPSGARVVERPLTDLLYSDGSFEELIEAAAEEILENIRALGAGAYSHRICDLTGGLDSRLVLAALLHEGMADRFLFVTSGKYPHPDDNVASMLRQRFGLTRAVGAHPPGTGETSMLDRMRTFLTRTFGSYTMLMNIGAEAPPTKEILRLHGGLGETFRGFYTSNLGNPGHQRMKPFYREIDQRGFLLAPSTRKAQKAAVGEWSKTLERQGVQSEDLLDSAYIAQRNRYHFGLSWRAGNIARSSFHPLYSPAAIQAAYALPAEQRVANRVGYELMRRFHAELAELPFANEGWDPSLHESAPPITRESGKLFEPGVDRTVRVFPQERRGSPSQWQREVRQSGLHPKLGLIERMLTEMQSLKGGATALAPVFVPEKVRDFLDRQPGDFIRRGQRSRNAYAVNRLLGALVWTNGLCTGPPPSTAGPGSGGDET